MCTTVPEFLRVTDTGRKISITTCYDYPTARALRETNIDALLVGDSVAMVIHGHQTPLAATPDMLALHIGAVARGAPDKLIIGDMPFPSFRRGINVAMECVDQFVSAGTSAVKLEGVAGHEDVIHHIVQSGIPVMGHLGLTPQSVHQFGGFKVQGRNPDAARQLVEHAKRLEDLGCFGMVLECIPHVLAREITEAISIPTIGIGAGPDVDGQVLVLHDLIGLTPDITPRFVRTFASGSEMIQRAVNEFHDAVVDGSYPNASEQYE